MTKYKGHEIPDEVAEFLRETGLELRWVGEEDQADYDVHMVQVPILKRAAVIDDKGLDYVMLMMQSLQGTYMVSMTFEQTKKLAKDLKKAAKR